MVKAEATPKRVILRKAVYFFLGFFLNLPGVLIAGGIERNRSSNLAKWSVYGLFALIIVIAIVALLAVIFPGIFDYTNVTRSYYVDGELVSTESTTQRPFWDNHSEQE